MTASYRRPGYNPWKYRTQRPVRMNRDSWQSHGLTNWITVSRANINYVVDYAKHQILTVSGGKHKMSVDQHFGAYYLPFDTPASFLQGNIDINGFSAISVSVWFKCDAFNAVGRIVSIHYTSNDDLRLYTTGTDLIGAIDDGTPVNASTAFTDTTNWHMGVLTNNGSTTTLYLDGVNKASPSDTPSFSGWTGTTRLGHRTGLSTYDPSQHKGPIKEVRVYNRALSDAEVAALYDPATRWELYQPPRRIWAIVPAAPVGRTTRNTDSHPLGIHTGMSWRLPTHP